MSFFVHSDDFKSGGSSSDGTWNFGRNVRGNWDVIGQHMDNQNIPWLWDGTNFMVMRIHDPADETGLTYTTFEITFNPSIGFLSNVDDIAAAMITEIQDTTAAIAIDDPYAARTLTYIYDSATETLTFHFVEGPVDIMWQGAPVDLASTINVPLGKDSTTANELNVSDLAVSTHNMVTDPKYVECYIAESNTQFATSHGTTPTLMFSTRDGEFTGQTFAIPKDTHNLSIQIKRMSDSSIVPLSGTWYLIFQSAS